MNGGKSGSAETHTDRCVASIRLCLSILFHLVVSEGALRQELQVALKAKETAENDRNTMELRAAGERAQHKSNMAFDARLATLGASQSERLKATVNIVWVGDSSSWPPWVLYLAQ